MFNPISIVSDDWEQWYLKRQNAKLCKLYTKYGFERTGCKGCPFALDLQKNLDRMQKYFPQERKQCEIIWKPVYAEYRRIGYRLKSEQQITFDELLKE